MSHEPRPAARWAVALALGIVYLVWGSTYAGIRVALEGLPPFLLGGTRFLAAGGLLLLFALAAGHPLPSRRQVRDAAAVGFMLLTLGNGGVVWAEQHVASGLAAVIVATVPLWMVVADALHPRGERLTLGVLGSVVLGLGGVGLLMAGGVAIGQTGGFWAGVAVLLGASFAWAFGSIYGRYAEKPSSQVAYTALEMLAGGAFLTLIGTLRGEWARVDLEQLVGPPLWGQLYLIVFGSIVAFSAYVWLLRAAPPGLVGTYAYVNPVVAVALGIALFGETLDGWMVAGSVVILLSVVLTQVARLRAARRLPTVAVTSPAATAGPPSPGAVEPAWARSAARRSRRDGRPHARPHAGSPAGADD